MPASLFYVTSRLLVVSEEAANRFCVLFYKSKGATHSERVEGAEIGTAV